MKQRALYSDCYEDADDAMIAHLPGYVEWRNHAWDRLSEAKALVLALRDYPLQELNIWRKHADAAHAEGRNYASILEGLREELQEKGFLKPGTWDTLFAEIKRAQVSDPTRPVSSPGS